MYFSYRFPFDLQSCKLRFRLNGYTADDVYFNISPEITEEELIENNEWAVLDVPLKQEVVELQFHSKSNEENGKVSTYSKKISEFVVNIKLERASTYYMLYIICPTILLDIIGIFAFLMPNDEGISDSNLLT